MMFILFMIYLITFTVNSVGIIIVNYIGFKYRVCYEDWPLFRKSKQSTIFIVFISTSVILPITALIVTYLDTRFHILHVILGVWFNGLRAWNLQNDVGALIIGFRDRQITGVCFFPETLRMICETGQIPADYLFGRGRDPRLPVDDTEMKTDERR